MTKRFLAIFTLVTLTIITMVSAKESDDMKLNSKSSVQMKRRATESEERAAVKITVQDAISSAVKSVSGKVFGVELENQDGNLIFTVEIETSKGMYDVAVDAGNGKVLGKELDKNDGEDNDGEENDDN